MTATLPSLATRDSVHDGRSETAELVRSIARDPRFVRRREELSALADAVSAGGAAGSVWRGADLLRLFSPESTIRLGHRAVRLAAGLFGVCAAIVVFLPVGWTWWSFRQAVLAYQQLLGAEAAHGVNFLQLWTTGFGHSLPERFWLSNVAQGSAVLIALSIILIMVERLLVRYANQSDENEYQGCAARLTRALTYSQITINNRDARDPLEGMDLLIETSRQLIAAHHETREAVASLGRASAGLEDTSRQVTAELGASAKSLLLAFENSLSVVTATLKDSVRDTHTHLIGSVSGVTQELERSVLKASGSLETSVSTALGELNTSVGHVVDASSGMESAANASASAQQVLAKAANAIVDNTQRLDDSLRRSLQGIADGIGNEVSQFRLVTGNLAQSTDGVGNSLGHHTSALQHQITELTQIRASLERVLNRQGLNGTQGSSVAVDAL